MWLRSYFNWEFRHFIAIFSKLFFQILHTSEFDGFLFNYLFIYLNWVRFFIYFNKCKLSCFLVGDNDYFSLLIDLFYMFARKQTTTLRYHLCEHNEKQIRRLSQSKWTRSFFEREIIIFGLFQSPSRNLKSTERLWHQVKTTESFNSL